MALTIKGTIGEMQQLATAKGGICLSEDYINSKTKLVWECRKGHRWEATPFSVKVRESWCPACANNQPLGLIQMNKHAIAQKGKCLSKTYVNVKTKLLWQCHKKHRFEAIAEKVRAGQWCPECRIEKTNHGLKDKTNSHANCSLEFM